VEISAGGVEWIEFRLPHHHGAARRHECRDKKERITHVREVFQTAACQATMMTTPVSTSNSPRLLRGRAPLSQNDRGDQSNEQRHATRVERALIVCRREA